MYQAFLAASISGKVPYFQNHPQGHSAYNCSLFDPPAGLKKLNFCLGTVFGQQNVPDSGSVFLIPKVNQQNMVNL